MKVECKATYEWGEGSRYIARVMCKAAGCSFNQKDLSFGQMDTQKNATESLRAYLDSHCPIKASATTVSTSKIT